MGILLKNVHLVLPDNKLVRKDVYLKGNLIKSVSDYITSGIDDEVIEGKGNLLVPGLANCHTHLSMTLLRGMADDIPLKEWLENKIWPTEEKLSAEDIYWGAMLGIVEMIKGGTTFFVDMYFYEDEVARAVSETGIRACLSPGLIYKNSDYGTIKLAESIEFVKKWNNWGGLINTAFGPHALYTCPPEYISEIVAEAKKNDIYVNFHFLESAWERDYCINKYKLKPIDFLFESNLDKVKTILAHGVHITEEEATILAKMPVILAHNPTSNLKLGSGIAPISKFTNLGMKVCLGTDGVASNNDLDMWEEGRLMSLLQKGVNQDPTLLNAKQSFYMMTAEGYSFFGKKAGKIEEGYLADVILIDLNNSHLVPLYQGYSHLVYNVHQQDVLTTIVNGKILMHNRILSNIDEDKVLKKVAEIARRLSK